MSPPRARTTVCILALAAGLLAPAAGAAPVATAAVDRTTVGADETLSLSITVSGADDAQRPDLSDLRGFEVVSTGQSQAISMSGGATSIQTVFEYVLRPTSQGTKTIPSVQVRAGNRLLSTQPIAVQVTAPRGGSGTASPTLPVPSLPPAEEAKGGKDDVFVRCTVDKKRAYVGEQIVLTFSLYYATPLGSVDYEPAGTEGFRTTALPAPASHYEVVNGRQYAVKQEWKLLFPTAPGAHTITPGKVQYTTGFWDSVPKTLTTEPITVEVTRLPESGKPASFSGVVGELEVAVHVDRDTIKMGEAATLTTTVTGWGNLDAMEPPKLALPEGLRQYQSSEHREASPQPMGDGFRLGGEALFDNVIIPTTLGDLTVPPVEIGFFDLDARRYDVARSRPVVLHVVPGEGEVPTSGPGQTSTLKPLPDRLVGRRPGVVVSGPVLATQVVALGWLVATAFVYRRRSMLAAHPKLARARAAAGRAVRSVKEASALVPREAAAQIAAAVSGFVADRLDVPPATVSAASVAALLQEHGAPAEEAAGVASLLDACDALRFAPASEANAGALANRALAAIRGLDRGLRARGGGR